MSEPLTTLPIDNRLLSEPLTTLPIDNRLLSEPLTTLSVNIPAAPLTFDINSEVDAVEIITACEFWMIDTIPNTVFEYTASHPFTKEMELKIPTSKISPMWTANYLIEGCAEAKCSEGIFWCLEHSDQIHNTTPDRTYAYAISHSLPELLNVGIYPNITYLLPYAVRYHNTDLVRQLFQQGCTLSDPKSTMIYATHMGNLEMLTLLHERYGIPLGWTDYNSKSGFYHDCLNVTKIFHEKGYPFSYSNWGISAPQCEQYLQSQGHPEAAFGAFGPVGFGGCRSHINCLDIDTPIPYTNITLCQYCSVLSFK